MVSIWGHKFVLWVDLKYISLFAVTFGVFICQALPCLYLLRKYQKLAMAYKFDEFAFLLAMLEQSTSADL